MKSIPIGRTLRARVTPAFLLLTALVATPARSQTPIPDEIDFRKYETLYRTAKTASDAKRAAADKAGTDLETARANVATLDGNLRTQRETIARTQSDIAELRRRIADLGATNQALAQELNRHQSDLSGARTLADRETARAQELRVQLGREQATYDSLNAAYQRELGSYQAVRNRLAQATTERDAAANALATTRSRLADVQARLQTAQTDLQRATDASRRLELSIANLQPQLQQAQNELTAVESQLRAAESQLQGYYDRERSALAARDAARSALSGAQSRVDQANAALSANRNEQSSLASAIDQLSRSIAQNEAELANLNGAIASARNELQNLENENRDIDGRVPGLVSRIGELRLRQGELSTQIDRKRVELAELQRTNPADPRIGELQNEINALSGERDQVAQQRLAVEGEKRGLDARKTQLVQAIPAARSNVANLESRARTLPGTIAQARSQLAANESRRSQLASQEGSLASALENARSSLAGLQNDANAKESSYQAAVRERQNAEAPLAPLRARQRELAARRDQLAGQLNDNQMQLASQRSIAQNARAQVQQLGIDAGALQNAIPNLQATYDTKARAVETFTGAAEEAYRRATAAEVAAQGQANRVEAVAAQLSSSESQRAAYAREVDRLQSLITQRRAEIAANEADIRQSQTTLTSYANALPGMQRQEAQILAARDRAAAGIPALESSFASLSESARVLEVETARRFAVYEDRKAKFDVQAAASKASGIEQGQRLGRIDGPVKGEADGTKEGRAKGTLKGTEEGLAFGLQNGKTEGDAKGYDEGKAKGLASAADYQAGYAIGTTAGKQRAADEANAVDYPRGKADRRAEIFAQTPARTIEIDNAANVAATANFVLASSASSATFDDASLRTEIVFALESDRPAAASSVLALVLRPTPKCEQAYVEFRKVCQDAFAETYDAVFQELYAEAYARAFAPASEAAYRVAFDANKAVKYAEGYRIGYAAGSARGLTDGKVEAKNRGVSDGDRDGYQSVSAGLKAAAYARGVKEMNDAVAVNPLIDVRGISFDKLAGGSGGANVIAGDRLALRLSVANLGLRDSTRAQIRIEAEALTRNVAVENRVVQLAAIPNQTLASVRNVLAVKILDGAAAGSTEQVRLRWNDSEGIARERVVSIVVTPAILGAINSFEYDASPKPNKVQRIKVSVSNTSRSAPVLPVTVVLVSNSPASDVTVDASTVTVNPFPPNTSWLVGDLMYTVHSKEALQRGISFTVKLLHGTSVIATKDLLIRK